MPKASTKKAAPVSKPVQQNRSTAAPSKAGRAAAHQGRPIPQDEQRSESRVQVPVIQPYAPPVAPAANLPSFMRQDADAGKELIGKDEMEVPRLKLMQGLSPELQEYDGLRAGCFFHPAAEFIFDKPFRAVPVFMDVQYILWRPRDMGGGILARTLDGIHWQPGQGEFTVQLDKKDGGATVTWKLAPTVAQSGLNNWGTMNPGDPNSLPAATQMFNYLLAFPDEPELLPAVLSFQRSSIKMGRRFNTKLKTVRAPIFGTVWEFHAIEDHNSSGQSFFNVDVRGAGLVEDERLYHQYRSLYESFSQKGLSIKDIEGMQEEGAVMDQGGESEPAEGAVGHQRF